MRKVTLWLCVLATAASAAVAQDQSDSRQARQAAAHELLLARGEDKVVEAMIETVSEDYVAQLRKKHPTISAEQLRSLQRQISIDLSATKDAYIDHITDLYADYFSVTDLKAATAFYQSDAGKKWRNLALHWSRSWVPISQNGPLPR